MPNPLRIRLYQALLLGGTLAAWEAAVRAGLLDAFFFPLPSGIVLRVASWLGQGQIYGHLAITLAETMLSFAIGTLIGVALGLWLALVPTAAAVLDPFIKAGNSIPRIVLAPIFTLWFGLGMASKVALGVTLVFFVAFFNTYQGVREVNPVVLANARLLGASGPKLLRHVYVPSAMSWILSSLRASIGFAVIGAVVGEYLGSAAGLGHVIAEAEGVFDSTGVFAGMVVLAAFVLLLDWGLSRLEDTLLVWRPRGSDRNA